MADPSRTSSFVSVPQFYISAHYAFHFNNAANRFCFWDGNFFVRYNSIKGGTGIVMLDSLLVLIIIIGCAMIAQLPFGIENE